MTATPDRVQALEKPKNGVNLVNWMITATPEQCGLVEPLESLPDILKLPSASHKPKPPRVNFGYAIDAEALSDAGKELGCPSDVQDDQWRFMVKYFQENYHNAIDLRAVWSCGEINVLVALTSNWDSESMDENIESIAQELGVFLNKHKISDMQKPLWFRDYVQWFWRRKYYYYC